MLTLVILGSVAAGGLLVATAYRIGRNEIDRKTKRRRDPANQ
jgi:hypothetical protein